MDAITLKQLIEDAGYETRSYSGRGMYGAECLAFIAEDGRELYAVASIVSQVVSHKDRENLAGQFAGVRTDSMGRDSIIVYFPRVPFEE